MLKRCLFAGLCLLGSWQLGQGAYLGAKAQLAQWLLEDAWQQRRHDGAIHKPWPWADTWPLAKLHFPRQHKALIVLDGASGRNLAFGPAHISASASPGTSGVSVIGGHRDTHFQFLQQLDLDDSIALELPDGSRQNFRITAIQITDVRTSQIRLQADHPVLALVACYPFNSLDAGGPLRYLVIAEAAAPGNEIRAML